MQKDISLTHKFDDGLQKRKISVLDFMTRIKMQLGEWGKALKTNTESI